MKYYIVFFNKFDDIASISEYDNKKSFDDFIMRIRDNSASMFVHNATYIKTHQEIA